MTKYLITSFALLAACADIEAPANETSIELDSSTAAPCSLEADAGSAQPLADASPNLADAGSLADAAGDAGEADASVSCASLPSLDPGPSYPFVLVSGAACPSSATFYDLYDHCASEENARTACAETHITTSCAGLGLTFDGKAVITAENWVYTVNAGNTQCVYIHDFTKGEQNAQ